MTSISYPYNYILNIAGMSIEVSFSHQDAYSYFGNGIHPISVVEAVHHVPVLEWRNWLKMGGSDTGYGEYTCSTAMISDALLPHGRMIIHAAAFRFRDRAWLMTAPSGVGKSTQIGTLIDLYPNEFSVICGDRPVLQLLEDKNVLAHPSPWNGKEGWKGAGAAPLAGILMLERGEKTSLSKLERNEAVIPVMQSLISTFSTKEVIHQLAGFETELLTRIPVWRFVNGGVPESSRFLYEQLLKKEGNYGL